MVNHTLLTESIPRSLDLSGLGKTLQQPDWYLTLVPLMRRIENLRRSDSDKSEELYHRFLDFVQHQLEQGKVCLGANGRNWDAERKPIDTLVIHHSGRQPGMTLTTLNALHLLRLYAAEYARRGSLKKDSAKPPIYSHHFRGGKQVFYGYHWLLRMDGTAERLLDDPTIGWHAGNWEMNCRSVAVCLDNDYEDSEPSPETLYALATFIRAHYSTIRTDRVIGHCEANTARTCPGALFLPSWKEKLLKLLR